MRSLYNKLFLLLSATLLVSCGANSDLRLHSFTGPTMGTTYSIKVAYENENTSVDFENLKSEVDSVLVEVNRQMSTYLPNSEISSFNIFNDTVWFSVSREFAYVVDESIKMGILSKGALDITVGPVVNLWGFGPEEKDRKVPSDSAIINTLQQIGLDKIDVRLDPPALMKANKDIHLDLSATAKGYGVDKVFEFIASKGFKNILVEIGGELRGSGVNQNGDSWQVGISQPDQSGRVEKVIEIGNYSMATSGDYWNYFEENGVLYSHTINPRTGRPITHNTTSVTVIAENCLTADGLATAINVMGGDEGLKFAEENGLPVFMILKEKDNFLIKKTSKFVELFERNEDN